MSWIAQFVRALARKSKGPGSNPGPGQNFSLQILNNNNNNNNNNSNSCNNYNKIGITDLIAKIGIVVLNNGIHL